MVYSNTDWSENELWQADNQICKQYDHNCWHDYCASKQNGHKTVMKTGRNKD